MFHRRISGLTLVVSLAGCAFDSRSDTKSGDGAFDTAVSNYEEDDPKIPSAKLKKRLTGVDRDTHARWQVAGTDLGIPYVLENGSIGYLFGDTFSTSFPSSNDWRSPVLLRSGTDPGGPDGIVFDSAARVRGNSLAPELFYNAKNTSMQPGAEWSVIPNDGISFPETRRQLVSFMSVNHWKWENGANWRTNYASLAFSDNGNDFYRVPNLAWENNATNTDPYQMWSMQREGDWVYVYSVRAGRQPGPMMLRRVHWERMFDKSAYEGWGWNGDDWGWGRPCTAMLWGRFGEPSVRRLRKGTWAMAYLNADTGRIVTRTASAAFGPWSPEKAQVSAEQQPNLYGGFIHPWSEVGKGNLHLLVSAWSKETYSVSQYTGSL